MAWIRLDDQFPDHPKVVEAGPLASWLYVCGIGYCNRLLTDGFIPSGQVRKLADLDGAGELAARLVAVGLWDEAEGGYRIHDYLEYQPSAEEVKADRTMNKVRKDLYADPFLTTAVKKRDGDRCRYCYKYVRWTDRKSATGGTFDHIIPDGGNAIENLVVCCRGCNSGKGRRTPEQARMTLRPPFSGGTSSDSVPNKTESIHPYPTRTQPDPEPKPVSATPPKPPKAAPPGGGGRVRAAPKPNTLNADQREWFDRWYATYPNKQHRPEAERAFARLDPDDPLTDRLIADTAARQQGRKWSEGYIEHPATYLNNHVWDDDIEPIRAGPTPIRGGQRETTDEYNRRTMREVLGHGSDDIPGVIDAAWRPHEQETECRSPQILVDPVRRPAR